MPPCTQKLNGELLVPIDSVGYSPPPFPAMHVFLASCDLIAVVRIHGKGCFFVGISFFVGIDTNTIYQATLESDENANIQSDVASHEKCRILQ